MGNGHSRRDRAIQSRSGSRHARAHGNQQQETKNRDRGLTEERKFRTPVHNNLLVSGRDLSGFLVFLVQVSIGLIIEYIPHSRSDARMLFV